MKVLILALLFTACTQKYQTYHVIDKYNFEKENPVTPITPKLVPYRQVTRSKCAGQWLFTSNAQKKTDMYLKSMVQSMCPKSKYLVKNRLTELWWTTLIYSRSCVEMESHCPRAVKK